VNIKDEFVKHKSALLTKGSFLQNFSFSFTGNTFIIISQFVFAPILSRIYSPDAYGIFSVFNAIASNLVLIGTMRLEGAIVLEKNEREFDQLMNVLYCLALSVTLFTCIVTFFLKNQILAWFNIGSLGNWLYSLGPFVLLGILLQITGNLTIKKKAFKEAVLYNSPTVVGSKVFNVVYGYLSKGALNGFILSETLLRFFAVFLRYKYILKSRFKGMRAWKAVDFKHIFKKYKQFPLYDLPNNWLGLFSLQIPIFILSSFGTSTIGLLGFAASLLEMPMRLLGYSIQPVFLQKVSEVYYNNPEDLKRITLELFKKLLLLGVVPFSILMVFGSEIFQIVFGNKWTLAGTFTSYLSFFYLFRLISEPMDCILIVHQKQRVLFIFQLVLLALRCIVLFVGVLFNSATISILSYGIVSGLCYLILNIIILNKAGVKVSEALKYSVPVIFVPVIILFLIKIFVLSIAR